MEKDWLVASPDNALARVDERQVLPITITAHRIGAEVLGNVWYSKPRPPHEYGRLLPEKKYATEPTSDVDPWQVLYRELERFEQDEVCFRELCGVCSGLGLRFTITALKIAIAMADPKTPWLGERPSA